MENAEMIQYRSSGGRATITIDDPERHNPMSTAVMRGLLEATRQAVEDDEVRVIVYTGEGDRAFSAGGDLSGGFVDDALGRHRERGALADLFRLMERGGKPTVARVNGHALAGGFGLAVACDITICVESAKLGTTEVSVGLWPMMISAVLARSVPRKAALDLMLTGRVIDAHEAQRIGAVSRVVSAAELDGAVDEVVDRLLSASPASYLIGKDSFAGIYELGLDAALDRLQGGLTEIALTADAAEGIDAFLNKRDPDWSGS
ncbi:MAG: enoyl-CoA hydratase-related protein [Acidimicrobiia bacterium]